MKPYKNYETNEEFDSIPEGMVALGKQPDGTYVIKNSDGSYSRISASDPRATKMASETVEPMHINTKSGIDMYEGKNSTSIDPGNISDYSALFGNSRRNSQIANPYATDLSGSSVSTFMDLMDKTTLGVGELFSPVQWVGKAASVYNNGWNSINPFNLESNWYHNKGIWELGGDKFYNQHPFLAEGINLMIDGPILKYTNFVGNNFANRNRYFFDEIRPQSYSFEHVKNGIKAISRMFYEAPPKFNVKFDKAGRMLDNSIHPKWYTRNEHGKERINPWREQAWAKYLKIPESEVQNVLYLPNKDGSFRYNPEYISETYFRNNITKDYHIDPNTWDNKPWVSRDYLTTNGGNVGMKIYGETPDQFGVEMFDRWDLQPGSALWSILFKNKIPTPKFVRNWEAGKFLKGEPFDMRTRFVVDKEGMKNINYYDGKIGYITDFE